MEGIRARKVEIRSLECIFGKFEEMMNKIKNTRGKIAMEMIKRSGEKV